MSTSPFVLKRVDVRHVPGAVDWLRSIGVDVSIVRPDVAVFEDEDGYALHLTELLRNEEGRFYIDYARHEVASRPLVVRLTDDTWRTVLGPNL